MLLPRATILLTLAAVSSFAATNLPICDETTTCCRNTLEFSDAVTTRPRVLTIAHRGASYHLPEHTEAAYRLALELGADYIEPDLVVTKDHKLIAVHTVDLNLTTNVEAKFGESRAWDSPFVGRKGYWSFNFTLEEIKTLTVRQRLPAARTTAYDDLWSPPTLTELLHVLHQWNTVDLPQTLPASASDATTPPDDPIKPTPLQLKQAGMYMELKDTEWLASDAGIDMVDLFYEQLQEDQGMWQHLFPCFEEVNEFDYKVPGLVVQSFDGTALRKFHHRWANSTALGDGSDSHPEPMYVLLANKDDCVSDSFWFELHKDYHSFVDGLGMDKSCLLSESAGQANRIRAKEAKLALHVWTERPEEEYRWEGFDSALQETQYLICEVGVSGIFSESVSTALLAAELGCDGDDTPENESTPRKCEDTGTSGSGGEQAFGAAGSCPQNDTNTAAAALVAFVIGALVATMAVWCLHRKQGRRRSSRGRFGTGRVIPTIEESDEFEMT